MLRSRIPYLGYKKPHYMTDCANRRWFWKMSGLINSEYTIELGHFGLSYIKPIYCHISLNLKIHLDIHLDFGRIYSALGMTLRTKILWDLSGRCLKYAICCSRKYQGNWADLLMVEFSVRPECLVLMGLCVGVGDLQLVFKTIDLFRCSDQV